MTACEGRVLSGPIAIDQLQIWGMLQQSSDVRRGQHVTTGKQLAQISQVIDAIFNHQMEQSTGQPQSRDLVTSECLSQLFQRRRLRSHDCQTSAVQEAAEDLKS